MSQAQHTTTWDFHDLRTSLNVQSETEPTYKFSIVSTFEMTILGRFPLEVLTSFFLCLDFFTLKQLIICYDDIRQYFLLISDRQRDITQGTAAFFGAIPGIRRVHLSNYLTHDSNHLIKLFELSANPHLPRWKDRMDPTDPESIIALSYIDKYSFVYLYGSESWFGATQRANRILGGCKRVQTGGLSIFDEIQYTHDERYSHPSDISWAVCPSYNLFLRRCKLGDPNIGKLVALKLENVSTVENISLPELRTMSLLLTDNNKGSRRPLVKSLKCPRLVDFRIFYHNEFPILEDIDAGSLNNSEVSQPTCWYNSFRTSLQIVHTGSAEVISQQHNILKPPATSLNDLKKTVELPFSKNFISCTIIGGHDWIMEKLSLDLAETVNWRRTQLQDPMALTVVSIYAPKIVSFGFETMVPYSVIPQIPKGSLETFQVVCCAPGLILNRCFDDFCEEHLTRFMFHYPGRASTVPMPVVPSSVMYTTDALSLSGCELDPFVNLGFIRRLIVCDLKGCLYKGNTLYY